MRKIILLLILAMSSLGFSQDVIEVARLVKPGEEGVYLFAAARGDNQCRERVYHRWSQTPLELENQVPHHHYWLRGGVRGALNEGSLGIDHRNGTGHRYFEIVDDRFQQQFFDVEPSVSLRDSNQEDTNATFCNSAPLEAELKAIVTHNTMYFYVDYGDDEVYTLENNRATQIHIRSETSGYSTGVNLQSSIGFIRWVQYNDQSRGTGRMTARASIVDGYGRTFNLFKTIDRADINNDHFPENYWRTDDVAQHVQYVPGGMDWRFAVHNPNNVQEDAHKWWADRSHNGLFGFSTIKTDVNLRYSKRRFGDEQDQNDYISQATALGGYIHFGLDDFSGDISLRTFMTNTQGGITYAREFSNTVKAEGLYAVPHFLGYNRHSNGTSVRYDFQVFLNSGSSQSDVAIDYSESSDTTGVNSLYDFAYLGDSVDDSSRYSVTNFNTGVDSWFKYGGFFPILRNYHTTVTMRLRKGDYRGIFKVSQSSRAAGLSHQYLLYTGGSSGAGVIIDY